MTSYIYPTRKLALRASRLLRRPFARYRAKNQISASPMVDFLTVYSIPYFLNLHYIKSLNSGNTTTVIIPATAMARLPIAPSVSPISIALDVPIT